MPLLPVNRRFWLQAVSLLASLCVAMGPIGLRGDDSPQGERAAERQRSERVRSAGEGGAASRGLTFEERVDSIAKSVNDILSSVIFFDVAGVPLVVLCLAAASVWFTVQMRLINLRGFWHAVLITLGRYDDPAHQGEVSHFQALTAALSGTLGLGNIAGVAIAVAAGGPGATLWMIAAGLGGMSAKFVECTLGQKYREFRPDGQVMGGAMCYLSVGLRELGHPGLGKILAILFCVMCIGGSLGGGNAFQVSQSLNGIRESVPYLYEHSWIYGLVMTGLVGIVILGGIRRIGATAEKIVPFMCAIYIAACLYVLLANYSRLPAALSQIVIEAFTPQAAYGSMLGVMVTGFRRAAFSNEAGTGSAAIAHSAARTPYPVREGIVALLEPFIDTVVVCTMTALVIVVSGAYNRPEYADLVRASEGSALTSRAFAETLPWFTGVLGLSVFLFAYATLISWYYYGERCWCYLFGDRSSLWFKIVFLVFTFLGAVVSARNVLIFGDLMILGMAFPNLIGVVLLSGKVKRDLDDYWTRYQRGDFQTRMANEK
jgi:alanine or glycine:cation symporter, AGCS family